MLKGLSKKKSNNVDYTVMIKDMMALPQRKAPCIGAKMSGVAGSHQGTLLMCESELVFFVGSGSAADNVVQTIPYKSIIGYSSALDGDASVLTVDHEKHHTSFAPTEDSANSAKEWVDSCTIYLDLVLSRWMGRSSEEAGPVVADVSTDHS